MYPNEPNLKRRTFVPVVRPTGVKDIWQGSTIAILNLGLLADHTDSLGAVRNLRIKDECKPCIESHRGRCAAHFASCGAECSLGWMLEACGRLRRSGMPFCRDSTTSCCMLSSAAAIEYFSWPSSPQTPCSWWWVGALFGCSARGLSSSRHSSSTFTTTWT